MGKTLFLRDERASKRFRILFFLAGLCFLIAGIGNYLEHIGDRRVLGWLLIVTGIIYMVVSLIYFLRPNAVAFIKLNDSEIAFKKNPFSREVTLTAGEIKSIELSLKNVKIRSESKTYKLCFSSLSYQRRKNELPEFMEAVKEFKERNKIN